MNKADSRRLEEMFLSKGYETADLVWDADVIVFNTCSVREHAENKAMSHIGRLKFLKKRNPEVKIVVAGCMAQNKQKEIKNRLSHVDLVVGPSTMFKIPELLDKNYAGIYADTEKTIKEFSKYLPDIVDKSRDFSGYIPIMKGCNNFCSYCIVPYVRGREQYRPKDEIIEECSVLSKAGIKEIMLLGQSVNSHPDFKDILRETACIKNIKRVRFVTSYPGKIDKELVDVIADNPVLCNYFHIPIQSGSDKILKRMNRRYTIDQFNETAEYIRKKIPEAAISSDFIIGFPGETEEDFRKTMAVVEKIEFDQSFTFKYSPRPGTKSVDLEDDVPMEEKKKRLAELNDLCLETAHKRNKYLEGETLEVLAEEGNNGRTDSYKIVFWEGKLAKQGDIVKVNITEALPHSLKGIKT